MNRLTYIKNSCIKEDELYKKHLVAKESILSGIRNEKLVDKIQVSDNLQKKSFCKFLTVILF